jgi:DNA polymerase
MVRKPLSTDPPPVAELMKTRRAFGKVIILGCGYSMGAEHFADFAKCDLSIAVPAVRFYRQANPRIVALWGAMEQAFVNALAGESTAVNGVTVMLFPGGVRMQLPNGRVMTYHRMEYRDYEGLLWRDDRNKTWKSVFGGHLVENAVQAMSRDILAEALLRCEARGIKVACHVHDELIAVATEADAETTKVGLIQELSRESVWAKGLPLAAEGKISKVYEK